MSSTIFVIRPDNTLLALRRSPYDSEDLFQRLLADHPALLEQVAGNEGLLLLVQREAAIPEAIDGAGRWSLDHLFLDRSGVPVLVEVKRATDTRIRREVVAQMLDYAANGVAYWPIDQIVSAHRSTEELAGKDPDASLAEFLNGGDPEGHDTHFMPSFESDLPSPAHLRQVNAGRSQRNFLFVGTRDAVICSTRATCGRIMQQGGRSDMVQTDTSEQAPSRADEGLLSPSRVTRFWLKQVPYLIALMLTILGVAYTSVSQRPVVGYWQFVAVAMGVVCIGTGWLHDLSGPARFRMVWTQALHWLAFSVAMWIVQLPAVQRMVSANATGLALLMLLALGTFVAGVHVSWQICVLGIAMALFVPAIAWLQQSALFLLLGAAVIGGIAITFVWSRSGTPKAVPQDEK